MAGSRSWFFALFILATCISFSAAGTNSTIAIPFVGRPRNALNTFAAPYSAVKTVLNSSFDNIWKELSFPSIIQIIYGVKLFTYRAESKTRFTLVFGNGGRATIFQMARGTANCRVSCDFRVGIAEAGGTEPDTILLFALKQTDAGQSLTIRYRVGNVNQRKTRREMAAHIRDIRDRMIRQFGHANGCGDYPTLTGACNNLRKRGSGISGSPLRRMATPFYEDSRTKPRSIGMPNAREVSNRVAKIAARRRDFQLTDMFVVIGQAIDHDLVLTPSGNGMYSDHSMDIKVNDPKDIIFNDGTILFSRSAYHRRDVDGSGYSEVFPRTHVNLQTSFVDASHVYGAGHERIYLRTFSDGLMRLDGGLLPKNSLASVKLVQEMDPPDSDNSFFAAGDARANENALLLSMHTVFVREHNRIAARLKATNCADCDDEEIFQLARRVVITIQQKITHREWLPRLLGKRIKYEGYRPFIDAGIFHEFSTAAMRFGHSMQSENHWLIGPGETEEQRREINLRDSFFNPKLVEDNGIDDFLRGAALHVAQPFDHVISDSLRNFLFRRFPTALGVDLFAANIQRGRDHGLPTYNKIRRICGLPGKNFEQIAQGNANIERALRGLYQNPLDVDLFVAGVLEKRMAGSELGETFGCIVRKQFYNIIHGDRFWYMNRSSIPKKLLSNREMRDILFGTYGLRDLLINNTGITDAELPKNLMKRQA